MRSFGFCLFSLSIAQPQTNRLLCPPYHSILFEVTVLKRAILCFLTNTKTMTINEWFTYVAWQRHIQQKQYFSKTPLGYYRFKSFPTLLGCIQQVWQIIENDQRRIIKFFLRISCIAFAKNLGSKPLDEIEKPEFETDSCQIKFSSRIVTSSIFPGLEFLTSDSPISGEILDDVTIPKTRPN